MLLPQVVNAARVLAARPRSKAAQENMEIFKEAWEKQVRLLTESVDDITTIHDFLAVSGKYMCDETKMFSCFLVVLSFHFFLPLFCCCFFFVLLF